MTLWHAFQAASWGTALTLLFALLTVLSIAGVAALQERKRRNRRRPIGISARVSRAFIKSFNGASR